MALRNSLVGRVKPIAQTISKSKKGACTWELLKLTFHDKVGRYIVHSR